MFIGEYGHNLDEKGRIAIPTKFRAQLKSGAVVTKGLDACLFLYPKAEWTKLATKLAALPIAQANTRAFSRLMLAGAMEVDFDAQGRAVLPEYLRTYAGMSKAVVIAGLYNRIELWNASAWEKYRQGTESRSGDIAEALGALGV